MLPVFARLLPRIPGAIQSFWDSEAASLDCFLAISGKIVMYKVVGMCLFRNQLATCTMRTSALHFFRNDSTSTASYSACGTVGCNGLLSGSLVDYRPV